MGAARRRGVVSEASSSPGTRAAPRSCHRPARHTRGLTPPTQRRTRGMAGGSDGGGDAAMGRGKPPLRHGCIILRTDLIQKNREIGHSTSALWSFLRGEILPPPPPPPRWREPPPPAAGGGGTGGGPRRAERDPPTMRAPHAATQPRGQGGEPRETRTSHTHPSPSFPVVSGRECVGASSDTRRAPPLLLVLSTRALGAGPPPPLI